MAESRRLGGPGFPLVELAEVTIKRYRMLSGGETVLVALSGGPDSTALLDVMSRLSDKLDLTIEVGHVDHGLSPASTEVSATVVRRSAEAGFDVHTVKAPDLEGPNLHARARDFRYGFLEAIAEQRDAAAIATGHTLDDRVETTLARLIHGAATEGLAGIPPVEGRRIRPLIGARRAEARAYCHECSLEFFDDLANEDERFERVAVRKQLLSAIEDRWGDGAVRAMANSAERLREDADSLATLAERVFAEVAKKEGRDVAIPMRTALSLPRALRRRVLELAVGRVRDRAGGIEAALDALEGPIRRPLHFDVASGIEIIIDKEKDLLVRLPNA